MQSRSSWKWLVLAAAGVGVAAGAVFLRMETSGSLENHRPPQAEGGSQASTGETPMSSIPSERLVQHANDTTFDQLVLQSQVPVLVDFYADWCGPCQRLAPVLEQLAAENPKAAIVKVNVDQSPRLASEYGIDSIPNLKLFKNGTVAAEVVGLASKGQLERLLQR